MITLAVVLGIALPFMYTSGYFNGHNPGLPTISIWLLPVYYACCVPAIIALIALDRMLTNIRAGLIFVQKNVGVLRIISWACFAVAAILIVGIQVNAAFGFIAIIAAFFGLILRVVKNLFAAAVTLQDENDYTI
jgi:hypothetical protein